MSDDSEKLLAKLDSLNDSLDDLEEKLEPLLAQTLPESLLPLETIQQAKLNVVLPYLVYDLVFIYLKTRGIDPKTHPVVSELDRVRQYFDKIKNAEDPEKRKTTVDKAAANRFIKHAIAQVRAQRPPGDNEGSSHIRFDANGNTPSPATVPAASIPVKVTSKMRARAEYERQLAEQGSDEDDADELEVFADGEDGAAEEDVPETKSSKDKGKGRATEETVKDDAAGAKKRRRPAMDPFAGYGDEQNSKAAKSPKKQKQKAANTEGGDSAAGDNSGSNTPASTPSSAKKTKDTAKKAKKKSKKAS